MPAPENFEFVNRTEELDALRDRVLLRDSRATVTFLRSPSGYGKSRLTDRLIDEIPRDGPTCVLVDPAIRSKSRSDRIYAWFFVQRAAEPAARRLVKERREYRSFADFIGRRGWRKIQWRHMYDSAKGVSSLGGLLKVGWELSENLFKRGRYNPVATLQDDSAWAAELAQEYVRALLSYRPTLFIIRETQNIDPESLKFFLAAGTAETSCCTIFEYTTPDNKFSDEHEKIILDSGAQRSLVILDLVKLKLTDFRYLLKKYAPLDRDVHAMAEVEWDGNLRIIRELKYRVMVRHAVGAPAFDLQTAMQKNLASLSARRQLILALLARHVEAIERVVLTAVLRKIDSAIDDRAVASDLEHLAQTHGYISLEGGRAGIADEDLLTAIMTSPAMAALLKLGAVSLREYYLDVLSGGAVAYSSLNSALRQSVALCAATADIFALRNLIGLLDRSARQAHNQALYVNIVADAVLARPELSEIERQELVEWAAASAYETGDYSTAVRLLESLTNLQSYDLAMLACCYGEINRHQEALNLVHKLRASPAKADWLAAKLIECLILFALGQKDQASLLHAELRRDARLEASPLFGFVLRFSEVVHDFPDCTADVLESASHFRRFGLAKSAAYSSIAGAAHLAYLGKIRAARQRLIAAEKELRPHVRDQTILLNNSVMVELLSTKARLSWCLEKLHGALFTVGDDFSRLTLHSNCLICYALQADKERGNQVVDAIDRILKAPGFGNRDIFVTVCYNIWRFCVETEQPDKASRFKSIALNVGLENTCYSKYWNVRFGFQSNAEPAFSFLLQHRYHPEYLSHWLVDLEGLSVLKVKDERSLHQTRGSAR